MRQVRGRKRERIIAAGRHFADSAFSADFRGPPSQEYPHDESPSGLSPFLLCALMFPVAVGTAAEDANPTKAEAELKAVRSQIDKVRAEMERDAGSRDQLDARARGNARRRSGRRPGALDRLRRERAVHTARRAELAAKGAPRKPRSPGTARPSRDRSAPRRMIGRQEPLKLLLNQRDPGRPAVCWSTTSTSAARAPARSPPSMRTSTSLPGSTRSWPRRNSG